MLLLFFNATENCGYKYSDYFEQLYKESLGRTNWSFFIAVNDDAWQIEI